MNTSQIKVLELIKNNPVQIGKWLGFNLLTELHNDWIKKMLFNSNDFTLQAHRGSYKTTIVSIAIAIYMLIYPKRNIIFIRKTDADIVEIIEQVKKILTSPVFRKLSIMLYNTPIELTKANSSEVDTNLNNSTRGIVQLLGIGINGSLTGKHADWIHTDDIVNLKDRISKAEREHTKAIYMELQNVKNRGGRITNTGTPWHKDDAFNIMPTAIKYDCYSTGLISKEDIEKLRNSMSPSLFSANYELKHIANEDALFKTPPKFFDDVNLLYEGQSHIDASYGGEDGSAFTIIKKRGDIYYVFGKLKQKHIDDCLDELLQYHKYYRSGSLRCETNGDKGYLAKEIQKYKIPVITYAEHMNKYIKIATYLKANWENIYFLDKTDMEYIEQIMDYTEDASHDDAPDSLASIIRENQNQVRRGF